MKSKEFLLRSNEPARYLYPGPDVSSPHPLKDMYKTAVTCGMYYYLHVIKQQTGRQQILKRIMVSPDSALQ
jgi:hypothetical protein